VRLRKYVILDIDNCVLDSRILDKYVPEHPLGQRAWETLSSHFKDCKPNPDFFKSALLYHADIFNFSELHTYFIVFLTSRMEKVIDRVSTRTVTEHSLRQLGFKSSEYDLVMRRPEDLRSAPDFKKEATLNIIKGFRGLEPLVCIDDMQNNVEMFMSLHLPSLLYNIEENSLTKLNSYVNNSFNLLT